MRTIRSSLMGMLLVALGNLPLHASADDSGVYNLHRISDALLTAGQIKPDDLPVLEAADIGMVINLAPASEDHNRDESFWVTGQGMAYVQIPVPWEHPTEEDLNLFFDVMDTRGERNVLVHCFANYRASAFTYLYRVLRQGVDEKEARADLEVIWDAAALEQFPQWTSFIEAVQASAAARK